MAVSQQDFVDFKPTAKVDNEVGRCGHLIRGFPVVCCVKVITDFVLQDVASFVSGMPHFRLIDH